MSNQQLNISDEWVTTPTQSVLNKRDRNIYNLGKEKGAQEVFEHFDEMFKKNLVKSYASTTKILEKIKSINLEILSARLKVLHPDSLKVVISIKETDSLYTHIDSIYNFISEIEDKSNNENYNLDFSIIKANEAYDEANIENDGYIYKHLLVFNAKRTRRP